MMQEVRSLRRYPKEGARRSVAEQQLAEKLRHARKAKKFSPEQEAELKALQQAEMDSSEKARRTKAIAVWNAAYYQKNKARLVAKQKEYNATPQGKTKRKEYRSSPHGKVKEKVWDAKRRARRRVPPEERSEDCGLPERVQCQPPSNPAPQGLPERVPAGVLGLPARPGII